MIGWYLEQGDFGRFNNLLRYWDIMHKEVGFKGYEIFIGYLLGSIQDYEYFPHQKQLENYKTRLELLYAKYH